MSIQPDLKAVPFLPFLRAQAQSTLFYLTLSPGGRLFFAHALEKVEFERRGEPIRKWQSQRWRPIRRRQIRIWGQEAKRRYGLVRMWALWCISKMYQFVLKCVALVWVSSPFHRIWRTDGLTNLADGQTFVLFSVFFKPLIYMHIYIHYISCRKWGSFGEADAARRVLQVPPRIATASAF